MSKPKMTACMSLVSRMDEQDQDMLLDRLALYQKDGIPAERAQVMAASDTLAELEAERKEFMVLLREQHPDLFLVKPEAVKAKAEIKKSPDRDITDTPQFKRWFGDSQVVDDEGRPLVVYHGAKEDIEDGVFRMEKGMLGIGAYFTSNPQEADFYTANAVWRTDPNIVPAYVSIKNPYIAKDKWDKGALKAKENGHDGVILMAPGGGIDWAIPFSATQIKSAIGNNGDFDATNPDIRKSERKSIETNADAIAAMDAGVRDDTELGQFPGGPEAYNLYEARTLLKKPSDKLKRVTENNSFSLWQDYDYIANVDGEHFGVAKQEDPDEVDDETRFVYSFDSLKDGRDSGKSTTTDQVDELFKEMRASMGGIRKSERRSIPGFTSALAKGIQDMPTKAALAGAWQAQIKGLVNKGVVKADELEWSGLTDWLELQGQPQAVYEPGFGIIQEHKADDGSWQQVDDLAMYFKTEAEAQAAITDELQSRAAQDGQRDGTEGRVAVQAMAGDALNFGKTMTPKITKAQIAEYLKANGVQVQEVVLGGPSNFVDEDTGEEYPTSSSANPTKYNRPDLVLPGGENYREVLLTLPDAAEEVRIALNDHRRAMLEKYKTTAWTRKADQAEIAEAVRLNEIALATRVYKSSHWDQPNVIAHLRLNDRTDAEGNKVLFVEEIQSDWGQDGKKKGFATNGKLPDGWIVVEQPTYRYRNGPQDGTEWMVYDRTKTQVGFGSPTREDAIASATGSGPLSGVPLAPFVTKTDGWLNLALKRVMIMAAEGGYDKVAFINGDQSAERYDLSKQVDAVAWQKMPEGTYNIQAIKGEDEVVSKSGLSASDVADAIGKDAAEKISSSKEIYGTLRGLDLKVGGEGMKTFYDQIIPQAVKKLLPKVGGGKVEFVSIAGIAPEKTTDELGFDASEIQFKRDGAGNWLVERGDQYVRGGEGRYWTGSQWSTDDGESRLFANKEAAQASVTALQQTGFDVTPAMRGKVAEGLPLFSRQRYVQADKSDLYQTRSAQDVGLVSEEAAMAALNSDATSVRIMAKGYQVADGELVGARLNLNVLKNTRVPVMTLHKATNTEGYKENRGFYRGEVVQYQPAVTLRNAYFNVGQSGRENIAGGNQNKFPMASIDGEFVKSKPSFDGVEVSFNPDRVHLFVDAKGRPVRSAEEVSMFGSRAYARGRIEYYTADTAPQRKGDAASEVKFSRDRQTETPAFNEDIPNEFWLQGKIDYASQAPRSRYGVPKMGSITGYFDDNVMVPVRWAKDVPGQNGEQGQVRQKDLDAIRQIIRDTGKMPLNDNDTEYVPYIEIGYDGKPWVSEGNHRIMAAAAEGLEYIPAEVRYFDGGQRRAGKWAPDNLLDITKRQADAKFSTRRQTETPAFKRWSKGLPVYESLEDSGNSRGVYKVYHATTSDFNEFVPGGLNPKDSGVAIWLSPSATYQAALFRVGGEGRYKPGANVMPLYARLERPMVIDDLGMLEWARAAFNAGSEFPQIITPEVKKSITEEYDSIIFDGDALGWSKGLPDGGTSQEIIVFDPTQIKSAIGNDGSFDPANPDITKSTGRTSTGADWDSPSASKFDDMVYKIQDKTVDLKRVVASIREASGALADDLDTYLQEELYHGRTAKRTEDFVNMELTPLIEEMGKEGLSIADVEEYLHARHAPEANKVIAQRNPGVQNLQDGGSGMSTQDALDYITTLPADLKLKLEAAAAKVDAIIAKTNQLYIDYELESKDKIDGWSKMFDHYIPLQREDKDGSPGLGQGFSIKGKEVKGRTGSTRKVVDILANIALRREKAIVRGEKNRVSQSLVGLAQANPNDDFWQVDIVPTERVFNPATGLVEDRMDPMYKSRDNAVIAKIKDGNGVVREHAVVFNEDDPRALRMASALKNLDATALEGLMGVSAKISRYFASINTQWNPVFGVVNLVRDVQGALLNLSSTPLKGDEKKIAKYTASALKGVYFDARAARKGSTPSSAWSQLWDEFQSVGGQTGYRDLFANSAERAEAIQKALDPNAWMDSRLGKIFTAGGALKVPLSEAKKGAGWIFNWLSDYNLAMENGVRLAAYKAGLERGLSKEQAASAAKNLTVNFNRKGQASQQAGALYAFFNASVQGTARIFQTVFTMEPGKPKTIRLSPVGQKIVYGGMLLGSMQAMALAAAGFNDDDPPDFVRERSLIIPLFNKKYITIPMPLGYHVLPNLGRISTEFVLSGFKDPHKRALSVANLFFDTFNPIGNAGLSMQTLTPTALDPLVALTENKDWTGKPIARESFNKAIPGFTLGRDTATTVAKLMSEGINTLSGGNKYTSGVFSPTPDQIDYLIGQVTGGVGRELSKVEQSVLSTARGEELPTYKIPLVGRFVGDAKSQASEGTAFYANTERLNRLETEIKGLQKDGKTAEASELRRSSSESYLITMANQAERQIQKLRTEKRELIKADAPREKVKAIEERVTEVMARLNRANEALKEKSN